LPPQLFQIMYLEIITPDKKAFEGEVTGVKLPGTTGFFEILNNHAPIISTLKRGDIQIRIAGQNTDTFVKVEGGIVEMLNNKVVVLAEAVIEEV